MKINIEIDTRSAEDKKLIESWKATFLEFIRRVRGDEVDEEDEGDDDDEIEPDPCVFFAGPVTPYVESSITALWWALDGGDDALVLIRTGSGWGALTSVGASQYSFMNASEKVILVGWSHPRWYAVKADISCDDAKAKYGEEAVAAFTYSDARLIQITVGSEVSADGR